MSKLIDDIKAEEGFSSKPYRCTEGKLTIGYGFNLDDVGLSRAECDLLLSYRLNIIISQVKSTFYYLEIDDKAWEILYHMAYQIGIGGLSKFKNMIAALKEKDYSQAAVEMLDSLWAKQTKERANRMAGRMKGIK